MKKLILIILIFTGLDSIGQDSEKLRVRGFIDTYHAFKLEESGEFLASRSRFRGEIQKVKGKSYLFVSFNAMHNKILPELTDINFREAYLEYTSSNWGFKAGRQIIIWGKADGLRITDVIAPMDLTEFLAQDYDDIRMPLNAITFSAFKNDWHLELICVPAFESYVLPGEDNPWQLDYGKSGSGVVFDDAEEPDFNVSNMEYGGKLSFFLSGFDLEISALNTWNKAPVYSYYENDSTSDLYIKPEYHRLGFAGFGFSKPLGALILRGEGAVYFNKMFSPKIEHHEKGLSEGKSVNYLIGIDYYPGNEWTITGQFSDEYIFDHSAHMANEEHTFISTIGVTKKLFNSNLALSTFSYIGINDADFFNRSSIDYALSDNIHVLAGYDWFHGDEGMFGQYKGNSQMWIKAKFNF